MPLEIATSTAVTNANESGANTETVVGTVNIPQVGSPGQSTVVLIGTINVTPGAAVTSVRLRWRRGSLTGTVVGDSGVMVSPTITAGVSGFTLMGVDTPAQGDVPVAYVLTYAGAGEGGAAAFTSFRGVGIAG